MQQLQEAVRALFDVLVAARRVGGDGFGLDDIFTLLADEALRDSLVTAVRDAQMIPDEIAGAQLADFGPVVVAIFEGLERLRDGGAGARAAGAAPSGPITPDDAA